MDVKLIEAMVAELSQSNEMLHGRYGKVNRYLEGNHNLPYVPRGARNEYHSIARSSITNWLPKISAAYTQGLFVDGFRPARSASNAPVWDVWRANGMNARQSIPIRSALELGVGYGLTLPGDATPVMKAVRADRMTAWYEDEDDDWPIAALLRRGETVEGKVLWLYLDDTEVVEVLEDGGRFNAESSTEHGYGVCPVVRFRVRMEGDSRGIIEPLIPINDQINEAVFSLRMAIQYASFRQRWATGVIFGEDPVTGADVEEQPEGIAPYVVDSSEDGYTVDPESPAAPDPVTSPGDGAFEASVDRLWVTSNPDARFGDFAQTETSGHLAAYLATVRTLAALGQISPNVLTGDLVNLSAEALTALQDSTQRQLNEYETMLGESFEQWLRLTSLAMGDAEGAADLAAEVRWRDNEARSLAATVDALGKMAQMLQVPPQALWERIPGVSDAEIERWQVAADDADGLGKLLEAVNRQGEPAEPVVA